MFLEMVLFSLLGMVAGTLAGLFGVGGGIIVVPALLFVFHLLQLPSFALMHLASGTSLAIMVLTSLSSCYAHYRQGHVVTALYRRMAPGIIIGTLLGALLAHYLTGHIIEFFFGMLLLVIGCRMLLLLEPRSAWHLPPTPVLQLFGMVVGFKSGLLGVGGGLLTVPFLIRCHVPLLQAIGTSAACGLTIAIMGSISFLLSGWQMTGLPPGTVGYIYLPAFFGVAVTSVIFAPLGAKLSKRIPTNIAKRAFGMLLIIVALKML